MKVRIRNFQSITDARLDLEGFAAITGRTNVGKSALIRALDGAIFGIPGDSFVQRGSPATAVRINAKSLDVIWRKVKTGKAKPDRQTSLQINGTKHTKIGRDHQDLTNPLGFQEIETTHLRLRPQVAQQHDPIFLLTETDSAVAEVFKLLGRVDVITEAQRLATRDRRQDESEGKVRTKDVEAAKTKLEETDEIERVRKDFEGIRERYKLGDAEELRQQLQDIVTLEGLKPCQIPELPVLPTGLILGTLDEINQLKVLQPREIKELPRLPKEEAEVLGQVEELIQLIEMGEQDRGQIEAVDSDKETTEAKIKGLEKELGVCPTCGRSFDDH